MRRLVLAGMLMMASTAMSAAELTETVDRTFDVKPGARVVLTNVNGRVTVGSWDQPRVRVVALKEVEGDRDEVQAAMRELRVELKPVDGGLMITTHEPRRSDGPSSIFSWLLGDHVNASVRYDVTVPRTMNVEVDNTNGSVHLSGVSGRHALETTNGKIEVIRCAGSLDAATTNGAIQAELIGVSKGQPVRLETTNGRIELALPGSLGADVDASTTNGAIRSELPVATTHISSNSLRGTLNGGGTQVRMRTTNGGISIRTTGKS